MIPTDTDRAVWQIVPAIRRRFRDYWHQPAPILPHFGCSAEDLVRAFEEDVRRGLRNFGSNRTGRFDPTKPMTRLGAALLATGNALRRM